MRALQRREGAGGGRITIFGGRATGARARAGDRERSDRRTDDGSRGGGGGSRPQLAHSARRADRMRGPTFSFALHQEGGPEGGPNRETSRGARDTVCV